MSGRAHKLRSSRLVARQRKAFIGRVIFTFIVIVTCWEFVFWLTGLPIFLIRTVNVSGTVSVQASDIETIVRGHIDGKYYFTVPKANIFFYPKSSIESDLKSTFPELETVKVSKNNFRAINVVVSERLANSLWCQLQVIGGEENDNEICYFQDNEGYIFAPLTDSEDAVSDFVKYYSASIKENPVGQSFVNPEQFKKLHNFVSELKRVGLRSVYIKESPDYIFEAGLSGGQRIIFSLNSDLTNVLSNLESIVADENFGSTIFAKIDYIDLRFGNKIFYKLK